MFIVFSIISLLLSIPALVLLLEVLSVLFLPDRNQCSEAEIGKSVTFKVIVPAHNEENILEKTLDSLIDKVPDASHILVVADNCTDQTFDIARKYGVDVLVRVNSEQMGKGYALDFGVKYLSENPPDVAIFLDADCRVQSGSLSDLATFTYMQKCPVQTKNIQGLGLNSGMKDRIAAFAFIFKNHIRPKGLEKLGFPCLLTGTGMAFPWELITQVNLATGCIVEDLQTGIELTKVGYGPHFFENITIVSDFPDEAEALRSQRTRWEHGHLQTILLQVPGLIKEAINQSRIDLFVLALEIIVPPLSLYVLLLVSYWAIICGIALIANRPIFVLVGGLPSVVLSTAVMMGWIKFGREILPLGRLLFIPLYVIWKIPVYLSFLISPEKKWIRTKRKSSRN